MYQSYTLPYSPSAQFVWNRASIEHFAVWSKCPNLSEIMYQSYTLPYGRSAQFVWNRVSIVHRKIVLDWWHEYWICEVDSILNWSEASSSSVGELEIVHTMSKPSQFYAYLTFGFLVSSDSCLASCLWNICAIHEIELNSPFKLLVHHYW